MSFAGADDGSACNVDRIWRNEMGWDGAGDWNCCTVWLSEWTAAEGRTGNLTTELGQIGSAIKLQAVGRTRSRAANMARHDRPALTTANTGSNTGDQHGFRTAEGGRWAGNATSWFVGDVVGGERTTSDLMGWKRMAYVKQSICGDSWVLVYPNLPVYRGEQRRCA